jgi:hypothetical protein
MTGDPRARAALLSYGKGLEAAEGTLFELRTRAETPRIPLLPLPETT